MSKNDAQSQREQGDGREELNAVLTDVVPWTVSLLLHVGIIILAFFMVWATIQRGDDDKIIVPIATLGATPQTPLTMMTPQTMASQSSSLQRIQTKNLVRPTSAVTRATTMPVNELGVAGSVEAMTSPFGTGAQASESLNVGFFGAGGNARSIVFVIDSSGSMIDTMPAVIAELKRTIGQLSDQQRFNVVFSQSGKTFEVAVPARGMKQATSGNKQKVIAWVDMSAGHVVPGGETNPTEAIKMALGYEPELVYILSDNIIGTGRYGLQPEELFNVVRENNRKPSKINTIQFYYPDPLSLQGRKGTLERISEDTGGVYKFVPGRDLSDRP